MIHEIFYVATATFCPIYFTPYVSISWKISRPFVMQKEKSTF